MASKSCLGRLIAAMKAGLAELLRVDKASYSICETLLSEHISFRNRYHRRPAKVWRLFNGTISFSPRSALLSLEAQSWHFGVVFYFRFPAWRQGTTVMTESCGVLIRRYGLGMCRVMRVSSILLNEKQVERLSRYSNFGNPR